MPELFVSSEHDVRTQEQFLHHCRKSLNKLARAQQILSRRRMGSKRYHKQRIKVARIHEQIAVRRSDYLHKLSRQIANAYDIVCVEDLNMKNMSQTLNFGRSVADNGWGMFLRFLDYKLADLGKALVKADKWYASSKTCHLCGYVNKGLTLSIRTWECTSCHAFHDRDRNAALNLKMEGIRMAFA